MKVTKNSGQLATFNRDKLKRSLAKSGASAAIVEGVLKDIEKLIYEGISTRQIYKKTFALLKKSSNSNAARYNLRSALEMLGPAGFFFEKFIARLYAAQGFETITNLTLSGRCVIHKIDIVTKKKDIIGMIECKFHSARETSSDVKVPMYILSRFNDLKEIPHKVFSESDLVTTCTIVTNNRFTSDAIVFANCMGMDLLGWDYPLEDSIRCRIDANGLYPVTCLTTLSAVEKEKLMILDILLARELTGNPEGIKKIGLSNARIKKVLREASELSNYL